MIKLFVLNSSPCLDQHKPTGVKYHMAYRPNHGCCRIMQSDAGVWKHRQRAGITPYLNFHLKEKVTIINY